MSKPSTAIVVLSDPKSGSEEALGRMLNALILAFELKGKHQEVVLVFQGAGTRWISEIAKPAHLANGLYKAVKDAIVVCGGCADAFGATPVVEEGLPLIREKDIPGTTGVVDLSRYLDAGYRLVTF